MVEFRESKSGQPDNAIFKEIWDTYYNIGADLDFLHEIQELITGCVQSESLGRMDIRIELIRERLEEVNALVDRASNDGATGAAIYIDTCGRREDLTLQLEICNEAITKLQKLFKSDAYWSALGDDEDDFADDSDDDDDFDGDEGDDDDDEFEEEETDSHLVLEARRQARERIELVSADGFFGEEDDDIDDGRCPLPPPRTRH